MRLYDLLLVTTEHDKIYPFQLFSCQPSIPDNDNTIIYENEKNGSPQHM